MKIIKLLFFVTMFYQGVLASNNQIEIVPTDDFSRFLIEQEQSHLNISNDKKFLVKFQIETLGNIYQPFEIKHGCLLQLESIQSESGKNLNIMIPNLIQTTKIPLIFGLPKFPIIVKTKETLSFMNLTYTWTKMKYDLVEYFYQQKSKQYLDFGKYLISRAIESTKNIPEFFQKCYDAGIFSHTSDDSQTLNYAEEKEEFIHNIMDLQKILSNKIDTPKLNQIFELSNNLDRIFSQGIHRSLLCEGRIYKGLTCSNKFVKDTYARAFLLYVLLHPNLQSSESLNDRNCFTSSQKKSKRILLFRTNYGQAASFLRHIADKNDPYRTHIIYESDYKHGKLETSKKSFWVIRDDSTYMDFYNALIFKLKLGRFAFNINDVQINNDKGYSNIIIDVEPRKPSNKELCDIILENKALDKENNLVEANGIRFVVRKTESGFKLITAFPIVLKSENTTIQQTGDLFATLKKFINPEKLEGFDTIGYSFTE
ncbi:MAG: hypothetical protein Q4E61_01645 [Alphaproteobacteria bacterium]|nr:hypothetical protein [Alphaproteobacteria bacterium]